MDGKPSYESDDEFFDCQSEACFYAVASPLSKGQGGVFLDPKRAYLKLRSITGARLKLFANHVDANEFANTPVDEENLCNPYPPSPKADVESSPYPSASQQTLVRFRSMLDSGNVDAVKKMVDENPMILVTTSDTPTILQIRFRYNALHVIASKGNVNLLQFLLNCIDSDKFWERLYPGVSKEASYWRQQYVLDLYLNSPELGNFETPLHFASKYGHIECVSMLARHPLTKLDPRNFAGHTPTDIAATRLISQEKIPRSDLNCPTNIVNRILQIFDESYIVLADVEISEPAIIQTKILAPLNTREFQTMLGLYARNSCKTFKNATHVKPFPIENNQYYYLKSSVGNGDCLKLKTNGHVHRLRGFSGPMLSNIAVEFRSKWLQYNAPNAVDYKSFSHLRLIDSEKGYERQGRYLSRVFGTSWYEYWEFLDDYIDLSSEDGLLALEDYLSNCSSLNIDHPFKGTISNGDCLNSSDTEDSVVTNVLQDVSRTDHTLSPTLLLFDDSNNNDVFAPTTPIIRGKLVPKSNSTINRELFESSNSQHWLSYRQDKGCIHGLNDSLENSPEQTNSNIHSHEEMSGGGDSIDKAVVVSPIVRLLKRLTFVSPMRWLRAGNQVDGDGQKSLTTDNIIPIRDANSTTNKLVGYESELRFSNKRRISASSIHSLDSPLEKPGGKKHSPDKTKTKPTSELTTKQLPHYFTSIYKALPGNDDELKDFNPLELPLQRTTPSLLLSMPNNSKFTKCIQLTEYVQSFLNKSS
uniref:ANK_REP_REGION domain-containing protein n=1 Tax=Schistosoma mansoni TaxID=6183 RepID=A0A5K4FE46_SCHMA